MKASCWVFVCCSAPQHCGNYVSCSALEHGVALQLTQACPSDKRTLVAEHSADSIVHLTMSLLSTDSVCRPVWDGGGLGGGGGRGGEEFRLQGVLPAALPVYRQERLLGCPGTAAHQYRRSLLCNLCSPLHHQPAKHCKVWRIARRQHAAQRSLNWLESHGLAFQCLAFQGLAWHFNAWHFKAWHGISRTVRWWVKGASAPIKDPDKTA